MNTVKWFLALVATFILGWLAGQICEAWAFFELDWSVEVMDIITLITEVGLAIFVAIIIEKSIQDTRIEKDFYIKEIDNVADLISEIDKISTRNNILSLFEVNYTIGRSRKLLQSMWKSLQARKANYCKNHGTELTTILTTIKGLSSRLTDTNYYIGQAGIDPISIANGKIYLNNTVKGDIESVFADLKEKLLQMKININKM